MQYKASSVTSHLPEKMAAATAPVAIGTRGTIGSLVRKEIDYFTKLVQAWPLSTIREVDAKRFA